MSKKIYFKRNSNSVVPSADILSYGEIAIGYKKGEEKIFFKNNNNEVISINAKQVSDSANIEKVTTTKDGLMSKEDKIKLDGITTNQTLYEVISSSEYMNLTSSGGLVENKLYIVID